MLETPMMEFKLPSSKCYYKNSKYIGIYYRPPCLHKASIELFINSYVLCNIVNLFSFSFLVMDIGLRNYHEAHAWKRASVLHVIGKIWGKRFKIGGPRHEANGKAFLEGGTFFLFSFFFFNCVTWWIMDFVLKIICATT